MSAKKILFLGAAPFQLPPIEYAKQAGYYIITCDNRPDNPGHQLADKTYNISTIDSKAILEIAKQEAIAGILTYSSDVAVPTVGFIANQLGLPGNDTTAMLTLTNKAKFRQFQYQHGFNQLEFRAFNLPAQRSELEIYSRGSDLPIIIKPVDVSGSRGITIIRDLESLEIAIADARDSSLSKTVIVEKFIERKGCQIGGDGYFADGKIKYVSFADAGFIDENGITPISEQFPSTWAPAILQRVKEKLQAILITAGYQFGPFNLEVMITEGGDPFIIELAPRCGGSLIASAIKYATSVDLTACAVEACLGHDVDQFLIEKQNNYIATYTLVSPAAGKLKAIIFSDKLKKHIIHHTPYMDVGCRINKFKIGRDGLGQLILKFANQTEMQTVLNSIHDEYTVELTT